MHTEHEGCHIVRERQDENVYGSSFLLADVADTIRRWLTKTQRLQRVGKQSTNHRTGTVTSDVNDW